MNVKDLSQILSFSQTYFDTIASMQGIVTALQKIDSGNLDEIDEDDIVDAYDFVIAGSGSEGGKVFEKVATEIEDLLGGALTGEPDAENGGEEEVLRPSTGEPWEPMPQETDLTPEEWGDVRMILKDIEGVDVPASVSKEKSRLSTIALESENGEDVFS